MAIIRRRRSNGSIAYGVQAFVNGEHVWAGTRDTKGEAKELEREVLSAKPTRGRETVAQFVDRYTRDFNHGGDRWSEESERNLRYALNAVKERFGKEKLARFPKAEVMPWISGSEPDSKPQPESVVRAARAMWNDAIRAELAPSNPFAGLGLERSRGRADIVALTEEELGVLAETALGTCGDFGKTMHALILFQGYVGCRPKETFNLRHRDVDYANGTVYISPSKNGKARTIILPPQAARALSGLPTRPISPSGGTRSGTPSRASLIPAVPQSFGTRGRARPRSPFTSAAMLPRRSC